MFDVLLARWNQGHRTVGFPASPPALPDRFRGRPEVDPSKCPAGCRDCAEACPTGAVRFDGPSPQERPHACPPLVWRGRTTDDPGGESPLVVRPRHTDGGPASGRAGEEEGEVRGGGPGVQIDLGRCLFCTDCVDACPQGSIAYTTDHRLATRAREDLIARPGEVLKLAAALDEKARRLFGRSLKLRQVSAGGCNACEADVNVLNTVVFDLGRFGIQFVASPRHADGLLVTGPVTDNMRLALRKTWEAVPAPKIAIAVGACAISGGPYVDHPEVHNGASCEVPIDLYIPGCPPHPVTILDGLLRLLGRLDAK
ncbi:MAG: 4Fe-4S dicluster domain-containing protein [Planctomycetes bacterium]|nr:4Fe-4S dicluster domain-containing protein [Planctomycetota bacterium]